MPVVWAVLIYYICCDILTHRGSDDNNIPPALVVEREEILLQHVYVVWIQLQHAPSYGIMLSSTTPTLPPRPLFTSKHPPRYEPLSLERVARCYSPANPFTMSVVLSPKRGPLVLTPISISPESRYLTLAVSDGGQDELVSLSPEQRVIFDLGQLPENHKTWAECRDTMTYGQFKEQNTFRMAGVKLHETDNLICDKQTGMPKVDENGQPTGQKWHTLTFID
jgi:hypothetical protein